MIDSIGNGFDISWLGNIGIDSNSAVDTPGQAVGQRKEDDQNLITKNFNVEKSGEGDNQGDNNKATEANKQETANEPEGVEDKNDGELSNSEQREVQELKETDRKVRAHEMAHLGAAQGIAVSGANFEYKRGPDGVNYAVGGDVQIDASKESDPEGTIDKARRIVAAALAPVDPSPQDRNVAAKARMMEANARMELAREKQEEPGESGDEAGEITSIDSGKTRTDATRPGQDNTDKNDRFVKRTNSEKIHPGIETYKKNQSFGVAFGAMPPLLDMVA